MLSKWLDWISVKHVSMAIIAVIGLFLLCQGLETCDPSRRFFERYTEAGRLARADSGMYSLAAQHLNGVLLQLGGAACLVIACLIPLRR